MQDESLVERVIRCVLAIPSGQVMSYGDIARQAGLPGRARWIGRILREADARHLPWHRVLRADGRPGFPEGSPQWEKQLARLKNEGVLFRNGRVRRDCYRRVDTDLDAILWGDIVGQDRDA